MTLDASKPNDSTLWSEMDDYQRETRDAVNDLSASISGNVTSADAVTSISGETVSADATSIFIYNIYVDGTLSYITGGTAGQICYLVIGAGHTLTVTHSSSKSNGSFHINSSGSSLSMSEYDVVQLVNLNGDPSTGTNGYWQEVDRSLWA